MFASAGDPEIRLLKAPIRVLIDPTHQPPPLPPIDTPEPPSASPPQVEGGIITPVPPDRPVGAPALDFTSKFQKAVGWGEPRGGTTEDPGNVAPPEQSAPPGERDIVPHDTEPAAVYAPKPQYPEWAREAGITGTVLLHVLVDREGSVARITVIRGVTGLDQAAQDGIRRWRFKPALNRGNPVAVWIEMPVTFRLEP